MDGKEIIDTFGNRLRMRVNGVLIEGKKILLAKHIMPDKGDFWAPPGGGMEFGSSAEDNIVREFKEETGLDVRVLKYLFVHEFLDTPLHAMEHFFLVERIGGELKLGSDPEMSAANQIIKELKFWSKDELERAKGPSIHQILNYQTDPLKIDHLKGYFIFINKSLK
jgi:8-oxo-dGTP diphosphatase